MNKWSSRVVAGIALSGATLAGGLVVPASATSAVPTHLIRASSQVAATVSTTLPLVRLHLTTTLLATQLPPLKMSPALATRWQQIGPRDVQAVAVATPTPALSYSITLPTALRCTTACRVVASRVIQTAVNINVTWEEQLLAELKYLPVSFTALNGAIAGAAQVPGYFTWRFGALPASFSAQWQAGVSNVIVTGAIMNFQNVEGLPTSGVMDPTTWNDLVKAVTAHRRDPASYNYVDVTQSSPETLTLYQDGVAKFHALVNTGIPQSPTSLGTYPVYLRYTSQTMSGTNPDGSHYSDPGIPWVSYFNGGDALHGFIRSSYGYPQSLGCVEMPFAAAGVVWPHTPIGTLVTVRA